MHIETVDPADEQAFSRWFAVVDAWQHAERPGEPGWLEHEQRVAALLGLGKDPDHRVVLLQAVDVGAVAGTAEVFLPLRDNTHLVELDLITRPAARRRGAATALLAAVEDLAREHDRTTIVVGSDEPPGQEGRSPSRGFGKAHGFDAEQVEVRRDISLPLASDVVTRLDRTARERAADYELRTWRDHVPADLVVDLAALLRTMSVDVPTADLDFFEQEWDAPRVRRNEQESLDMGRTSFGAGTVHVPSGHLVAYTRVGVPTSQPQRVYQWDTLVTGRHRGNRLGTLVKLACLQRLSAEVPDARFISTWNALENAPMIRVNDELGAFVNGQWVNWQKRL